MKKFIAFILFITLPVLAYSDSMFNNGGIFNKGSSSGGSITFTDGSHTVTGATQLTVTGGTVGGTTPNATLTITSGGSAAGPLNALQYNSPLGTFAGSSKFVFDGTNVGIGTTVPTDYFNVVSTSFGGVTIGSNGGGIGGIDANTTAMLHMDGSNGSSIFTDSAITPNTWTAHGAAQITNSPVKFGTGSGLFTYLTGDYISSTSSGVLTQGASYTIDFQWNPTALFGGRSYFGGSDTCTGDANCLFFYYNGANNKIGITTFSTGTEISQAISTGTWYWIAYQYSGGVWTIYVNGSSIGTWSNATTRTFTGFDLAGAGGANSGSAPFQGELDEVRISNVARTISPPPTSAYTNQNVAVGQLTFNIPTTSTQAGFLGFNGNIAGDPIQIGQGTLPSITISPSENVGIGTINPGTVLDVNGSVRMTGFVDTTSPTNGYVMTSDANGGGTWKAASGGSGTINSGTTNRPAYYSGATTLSSGSGFYNGTNVGIGTTLNTDLLDVAGGVSIGTTYAGYKTAPSNGLEVQGNVSIGTTTASQLLTVGSLGASTIDSSGNIIGNNISATQYLRALPIGSGYGVNFVANTDTAFLYSNWYYSSNNLRAQTGYSPAMLLNMDSVNGPAGSIQFDTTGTGSANSTISYTPRMTITDAGNIGIGVTVPVNILDVNAGAVIGSGYAAVNAAPSNGLLIQGNVGIGSVTPTTALSVNGGMFTYGNTSNTYLNSTGGNVGVGSPAPGATLDVQGTIRISKLGSTISIIPGTNACAGTGTLSSGTVTISTTCTPSTYQGIFISDGGGGVLANIGALSVGTVTAATSFVVNSANALDSSNFSWEIHKTT